MNRLSPGMEHKLDRFGMALVGLVAKLAKPAYLPGVRPKPVRRFLARRAIDAIVSLARVIDRLSAERAPRRRGAGVMGKRPALAR